MKNCALCWEAPVELKIPEPFRNAAPDSARMARIRESLAASAIPVGRLPSNAILIVSSLVVFLVLAILFAAPAGFLGFARMSFATSTIDYAVILVLAFALAATAVAQMVPGSRQFLSPALCICLALVMLTVTTAFLFPDSDAAGLASDRFMRQGIPCLRYGILCAIPAAGLTWVMMRRGFAVDPVRAAIAAGGFSGLLGFGVLALHCPIFSDSHIVAWHVGVVVVAALACGTIAWTWSRFHS
jgi:hypothetical protein